MFCLLITLHGGSMTTKGERTKQKILHESILLFSKNSFKNVTMRQIAMAAGISPALIYKYFATQEDLYYAAMQHASRELLRILEPTETLEEFVQVYLHHMFTSEVLFEIMTYFTLDQEYTKIELPIIEISQFLQLLEEKISGNNARIEAQLLFSTLNGLVISYKKIPNRSQDFSIEAIQKLASYYVMHLNKRLQSQ